MKEFTGWEYLLIDVANGFGHDKMTFEDRITWATSNLDQLELIGDSRDRWKQYPLYVKAVQAVRRAQRGEPIGHLVGFDAVNSGMQIMSVLTGCENGARATGLIDNDHRADAYSDCTKIMSDILGYHLPGEREKVKNAVMTSLYGSKAEPKKEFGEDTPELNAFYQAMYKLAPGPCELLDDLVNSWQPYADSHEWVLPDGFEAKVKVLQEVEKRIEIDELDHTTFTYVWYENAGSKRDVKNAANVVHSIDAYVLRSLLRRCNYDQAVLVNAGVAIMEELLERDFGKKGSNYLDAEEQVQYYVSHYRRSGLADVVILPYITNDTVQYLSTEHLTSLNQIISNMLAHESFEVVTVHDDFKCHPNNMNYLRKHYRNILAEMSESNMLNDILSQLYGFAGTFVKKSEDLSDKIYKSSYALC